MIEIFIIFDYFFNYIFNQIIFQILNDFLLFNDIVIFYNRYMYLS